MPEFLLLSIQYESKNDAFNCGHFAAHRRKLKTHERLLKKDAKSFVFKPLCQIACCFEIWAPKE